MKIERRSDNRMFDAILPVHIDIDQIDEINKTCKYITGNINYEIYNKNTLNSLSKIIGGKYNINIKDNKHILLGSGLKNVIAATLIGPVHSSTCGKEKEITSFGIRIKNMYGNRSDREKYFEEILKNHFENLIDFERYRHLFFNFKIQIIEECSYILSDIINSLLFVIILNNISLYYTLNSVNIGIVDNKKYIEYMEKKYASTNYIYELKDDITLSKYEKYKDKLFNKYKDSYIPKIIVDPLNEEIDLYCSNAFCYIMAPDFKRIISNIIIKNDVGLSEDINNLAESYAIGTSIYMHKKLLEYYTAYLKPTENYMNENYFY